MYSALFETPLNARAATFSIVSIVVYSSAFIPLFLSISEATYSSSVRAFSVSSFAILHCCSSRASRNQERTSITSISSSLSSSASTPGCLSIAGFLHSTFGASSSASMMPFSLKTTIDPFESLAAYSPAFSLFAKLFAFRYFPGVGAISLAYPQAFAAVRILPV